MEEGSLLQQALRKDQPDPSSTNKENNTILLDVYSLKHASLEDYDRIQHLLHLAELAGKCNCFLQSQKHHWHYGGDGPVFGACVTDGVPHLRAHCRYGPNISDEWMAIDYMLEMSQELQVEELAISCWDVDDGQVILIQTADVLPEWVDEDPTDNHRHACWIQTGKVHLIQQPHIALPDALQKLQNQTPRSDHPVILKSLSKCLELNRPHAVAMQHTPLVVPRKIAHLIRKRPDMIHAAIQEFCANIESTPPDLSEDHEDWVWTTCRLSRTNYAQVRTMESSEWNSTDFLPSVGVEVKRYKRQCAMEATPHLKYAVQLGVRLVAGFEFLAKSSSKQQPPSSSLEQRIAHWCRLDQSCKGVSQQSQSWILQCYEQGPNQSIHNLEHVLKCGVFPEETGNHTLSTYPEVSIKQQLVSAQKGVDDDEEFPIPLSNQVDDESWLVMEEGGEKNVDQGNDFDTMLSRFQNFMAAPSGVEGVTSSSSQPKINNIHRPIRPRVFMNILHSVLKGEDLSFPTSDPFFYQEDYDLMEADRDEEAGEVQEMKGLMDAMDTELKSKTRSRDLDAVDEQERTGDNGEIAEGAHVLTNLLQSLEANAGTPGPVPNMLKEMGTQPPR